LGRSEGVRCLSFSMGFRGDMSTDLAFLAEHGSDIEKIAIAGDDRWEDEALMFAGAGVRRSSGSKRLTPRSIHL